METYLVISEHTPEDCTRTLHYFHEFHEGYLTKFWWGCLDKDHSSYAIIEAESHEHAMMSVPPLAREKTKIIKIAHFNQLASQH